MSECRRLKLAATSATVASLRPPHDSQLAGGPAAAEKAIGAVNALAFAAAPAFALMALLIGYSEGGGANILCTAAQGASPFSNMTLMYLLMSVFHSEPWLKLYRERPQNSRSA